MATPEKYYPGQSLERMIELFRENYLTDTGWVFSAEAKEARDAAGPVPWITYPAFAVLQRLVRPHWRVFEFGTGASTLWWSARVASVVAVEHDAEWAAHVRADAPANVTVLDATGDAYPQAILGFPPAHFDVVVIDGEARVEAAMMAPARLKDAGFVLFDNSDRAEYASGYAALSDLGFRRIDFWGPGPINPYAWCTSIFTRTLDVFA